MVHPNYTLEDLGAGLLASILFASVAFAPGYVAGWLTDCFEFRNRTLPTKLLLAIALSISISPILCYWTGWLIGNEAIPVFAAISTAAVVALLTREFRRRGDLGDRTTRIGFAIVAAWVLVCIASLADLQIGDRLYYSTVGHDYSVRSAMTAAISRSGVRPANPFFLPEAPAPLRYHHFFYILCSAVDRLGGSLIDAKQSLTGGAVWAGIGLMAIIPLYLRFFCGLSGYLARRRSLLGIGLLAVTGLDLLPALLFMKFSGTVTADLDWWNSPIFSWVGTVLWAPHYVVSLISCLTGFLLLWCAPSGRSRLISGVLAGLAFASAAGAAIYIAMVFGVFLVAWMIWSALHRRNSELLLFAGAGIAAALLAIPHLLTLIPHHSQPSPAAPPGAGGLPFALWVRTLRVAEIVMSSSQVSPAWQNAVQTLLLPFNYFMEFGFFAIVAILTWQSYRRKPIAPHQAALALMALPTLLIVTFVRSSVIAYNDLGMRGVLVLQFVLVLWALELRPKWSEFDKGLKLLASICLLLGACGSFYEVGLLRVFPVLADTGKIDMPEWMCADRNLGRRTMAMRRAYTALQNLPLNAVIQSNPDLPTDDYFFGLYGNRQTAAANRACDSSFGGPEELCAPLVSRISPLFRPSSTKPAGAPANLTVLLFKDNDPIWADKRNWIWRVNPVFETDGVRVIGFKAQP